MSNAGKGANSGKSTPAPSAPGTLEVKDQLAVLLKEYESIRKQIDQGSGFMQSLVTPLSVGVAGAMIGWQGKIPPQLAIMALPVIIMSALAAAMHGEAYTEYSGQLLARVENRVFRLTGLPLLRHETKFAMKRKRAGGRGWWIAVSLIIAAYVGCEFGLYQAFGASVLGLPDGTATIAIVGASIPAVYGVVLAVRFQHDRHKWQPSALAKYLETHPEEE
jgi:hypothetical protein